jgi:hypothetical protein
MITATFRSWKLEIGNWKLHARNLCHMVVPVPILQFLFSGFQFLLLLYLGTSYAAAQAAAEYGGAVATAGARVISIPPPKVQAPAVPQGKSGSAHLTAPAHAAEDAEAANRKALEGRAGKDAAKVMLRSEPSKASVRVDGKPVGQTPLLLIVAPAVYKVEMVGLSTELAHQEIDLLPNETREVVLTLKPRYPTRVQVTWHH